MATNKMATIRFFWQQTMRKKWLFIAKVCAGTISALAGIVWVLLFSKFFEILSLDLPKDEVASRLLVTLFMVIGLDLILTVGWRIAGYINNVFQPQVLANIANECFLHIQKHSYRFFSNRFTGSLVKKVNKLVSSYEQIEDKIFWDMMPMALIIVSISIVLFYIHVILGVIMTVWTLIFLGANYYAAIFKFKWDLNASKAETEITGRLADTITNSVNIKLFSAHSFEFSKFRKLNEKWSKESRKSWNISDHIELAQGLFMILLEFIILYVAIDLWKNDILGIPGFFILQAYIFEMFHQLWNFGRNIRDIYESLADAEEMIEILEEKHEIVDNPDAKILRVKDGKVEFRSIKFRYEKGEESVINDLSFKLKPGEKIALIGSSGGGKSTIVKLMLRFFDPQKGQILVDGQDIKDVTQDSLRSSIALVPQDPILFHRSIFENIRYGRRNASFEEVVAASKMAHCDEFINKFPKGYKTFVGERGVKLSGGQKQRIAIARAILANPKILILDEATSSLDSHSENIIQDALDNLVKNKTTFIIAHRLSTIMMADRIFVLKDGRIVEEGNHADLVNKKAGIYNKLWGLQVGGYLK